MHQNAFAARASPPYPSGEAYSVTHIPQLDFRGPLRGSEAYRGNERKKRRAEEGEKGGRGSLGLGGQDAPDTENKT